MKSIKLTTLFMENIYEESNKRASKRKRFTIEKFKTFTAVTVRNKCKNKSCLFKTNIG